MPAAPGKAEGAFRTIGEVSRDTGLPQHILRYWETRFPKLQPLTRAGGRRYYRPEDIALVRRIDALLNQQGYTIRGVQQLLAAERDGQPGPPVNVPAAGDGDVLDTLRSVRELLVQALRDDEG